MRASSISEENSERGMLKTINYLAKSENKGETGSKHLKAHGMMTAHAQHFQTSPFHAGKPLPQGNKRFHGGKRREHHVSFDTMETRPSVNVYTPVPSECANLQIVYTIYREILAM